MNGLRPAAPSRSTAKTGRGSSFRRLAVTATLFVAASTHSPGAHAERSETWSTLWAVRLAAPHVFGVRASYTDVTTSTSSTGLSFWLQGTSYHEGDINFRTMTGLRLGQTNGIEAGMLGDVAIGRRFDVTEDSGVILRGGLRGFIEANDTVQTSMLEIPQVQLGYQLTNERGKHFSSSRKRLDDRWRLTDTPYLVEVAGRASLGVAARYEVGVDKRNFRPAPAAGGHVALAYGPVHVEGSFTRLAPTGALRTPFDVFEVNGCVALGTVALCGDARYLTTALSDGRAAPGAFASRDHGIVYAGFTLGLTPSSGSLGGGF